MELWKATMKNTAEKGTFRAFGWLAGWGWAGQRTHKNIVHVNSVFRQNGIFSHNNQPEQYFGLFFSPVEQAVGR